MRSSSQGLSRLLRHPDWYECSRLGYGYLWLLLFCSGSVASSARTVTMNSLLNTVLDWIATAGWIGIAIASAIAIPIHPAVAIQSSTVFNRQFMVTVRAEEATDPLQNNRSHK